MFGANEPRPCRTTSSKTCISTYLIRGLPVPKDPIGSSKKTGIKENSLEIIRTILRNLQIIIEPDEPAIEQPFCSISDEPVQY